MENVYNLTAPISQAQAILDAASLRSAGFKGSGYIQSILIDNPTGSWLLITSDNTFVPPYVVGYSHNLDYAATEISVLFVATGPAGQGSTVNTVTGALSKVRVVIYDHTIQETLGNNFITNLDTPDVFAVSMGGNVLATNLPSFVVSTLLTGLTSRRLRVYSIHAYYDFSQVGPGTRLIGEFQIQVTGVGGPFLGFVNINANTQSRRLVLSPPVTLPIAIELRCEIYGMSPSVGSTFTAQGISVQVAYGII